MEKFSIRKFHKKLQDVTGSPRAGKKFCLYWLRQAARSGGKSRRSSLVFAEGVLFPWRELHRLGKKSTPPTVTITPRPL
jgi:hypothetical protein